MGLFCWKEDLTMSQECFLWECCGFGSHCSVIKATPPSFPKGNDKKKSSLHVAACTVKKKALQRWNISCCLSGCQSELWTCHVSDVSHRWDVITTFTVHQTCVIPEFSLCWSMTIRSSSLVNREVKSFSFCDLGTPVSRPSSDDCFAPEMVQNLKKSTVFTPLKGLIKSKTISDLELFRISAVPGC